MAHIPPGVNLYTTLSRNRDVCKEQKPVMFLRDEKMVDVLTDYAADIRLAVFAHTHMDEMKLLQPGSVTAAMDAAAKPAAFRFCFPISAKHMRTPVAAILIVIAAGRRRSTEC